MNRLKTHTIDQPDSDVTTFVLSCNRLDVLATTLQSYWDTVDYVTKMVIVDDSSEEGVFETLVDLYGDRCDVICFPRNRGQWWALDFMVSYCDSEYIFYLEDDWELLQTGYIQKSKEILEKYRNIGTVDISWRTFEWQGIDSYKKDLIDDTFFYKKPWRITENHLYWYGWIGSPNLKRRDDLILLGRIEKWHNEWNIDRKYLSLGFKSVFLNGEYARHLGDDCSKMAGQRPNDSTVPQHYYPNELVEDRVMPQLDYWFLDTNMRHSDTTLVSMLINVGRSDRNFESHYLNSLSHILQSEHPVVIWGEEIYFDKIREIRGDRPLTLNKFERSDLEQMSFFKPANDIISKEEWINQSDWMKDSVITSKYYIPLTLLKQHFLNETAKDGASSNYYWVDAGMYSSFSVYNPISDINFSKLPKDKFFITSFPYWTDTEIHGYAVSKMAEAAEQYPSYVCRATLFGGTRDQIKSMTPLFYDQVEKSLNNSAIGTEESIYTILSLKYPAFFNRFEMPNGDINNLINTLRQI